MNFSHLFDPVPVRDWLMILALFGGILLLMAVLTWFILSERRERARFEASTLELSRNRVQKKGGLKLKPLPDGKGNAPDPKPADTKPEASSDSSDEGKE